MGNKNLDSMTEQAYKDRKIYDFLKKNHYLQWQKVVTKIVNKHFEDLTKEVKKEKE